MQATTNYTKIKSERFNMARKAAPLSFSPWSLSKRRRPVRSPSAVLSRAPALAVPCVCHAPTLFSPDKAQPLFARAAAPTAPPHTGRSCPPPPEAAPSVPFASSPALLVRDPLPRPNVIEHPMPGSWGRGRGAGHGHRLGNRAGSYSSFSTHQSCDTGQMTSPPCAWESPPVKEKHTRSHLAHSKR